MNQNGHFDTRKYKSEDIQMQQKGNGKDKMINQCKRKQQKWFYVRRSKRSPEGQELDEVKQNQFHSRSGMTSTGWGKQCKIFQYDARLFKGSFSITQLWYQILLNGEMWKDAWINGDRMFLFRTQQKPKGIWEISIFFLQTAEALSKGWPTLRKTFPTLP